MSGFGFRVVVLRLDGISDKSLQSPIIIEKIKYVPDDSGEPLAPVVESQLRLTVDEARFLADSLYDAAYEVEDLSS